MKRGSTTRVATRAEDSSSSSPQVVAYVRVSSKEQEREGYSIPQQLKLLRGYAAEKGLQVVQIFEDAETAKSAGRTGFGEMLKFLNRTPSCRQILVEKTDRLYRNFKDLELVAELGPDIHFVKENLVIGPNSPSWEKFLHGLGVLLAKRVIDNLSEEVRKGMTGKAEAGNYPSFAPLGYLNVRGPDGKNCVEIDSDRAPIVARMYEMYATGQHSVKDVAKFAWNEGLRSRKARARVPLSSINKILSNRMYYGDFDWKGKTYPGKHEPLVSRELWERVQDVFEERLGKRRRKGKHDFAFSGLISCGRCGCSLVGDIKKKRYTYYRCSGRRGKCPEKYTKQETFEEKFGNVLKSLRLDAEVIGWVTTALRQNHTNDKKVHEEAVTRLRGEYDNLQRRIDRAYDDKLDGLIDAAHFARKSAEWRAEQEQIQRTIDQHRAADQSNMETGVLMLELASRAHEMFLKQPPSEKRRLLNFLVSNSTWKDGDLTVTFRQPFDLLMDTNVAYERDAKVEGPEKAKMKNWPARAGSNR